MPRSHAHRLTTTLLVVLSLLFSQLALANYVCPVQKDAAAIAGMMAAGMPCEGMDMDLPALCAEHASGAHQSFEPAKTPGLTLPMVVQVLALPLTPDGAASRGSAGAAPPEAQPPGAPLFLATLRLRV